MATQVAVAADSVLPARLIKIAIERMAVETGKLNDTIDIMIESSGTPIAGFDLEFGLNSPQVEILEVLPGEICDSCDWELFDARVVPRAGQEGYPSQLWHAVALAETVPNGTPPKCFGFDRPASLVRLVVVGGSSQLIPDTTVPIFFFWEDCGDNTVADASGGILMLSERVVDYFPTDDFETDERFPTRLGAPRSCLDPSVANPPVRRLELHNGAVEFRLNIAPVPVVSDSTGAP